MTWQCVIGLEIHAQLKTASKIFSPARTHYCAEPNMQVCEVDGGMPGALPVLNRAAVEHAICLGLAVGAKINPLSEFARKNYFYPDLPKGYQISQFEYPIVSGGTLVIDTPAGDKTIGITRAHLEEDAGKLLHDIDGGSGVDLNRAGTPLLEIVSEPDLESIAEAVSYARAMHSLVRWLGVCDGNMQEGSFRMDANISVRQPGAPLGTRCEIKNLNSFRFLEQALGYEIERQIAVLEGGGEVLQETRLFSPDSGQTRAMRSKEDAHDYRYFPDPDLPPLSVSEQWIEQVQAAMPELPRARQERYMASFNLSSYDAGVLTAERALGDYFEDTLRAFTDDAADLAAAKMCANWVCGEISAWLNKSGVGVEQSAVSAAALADLLRRVSGGEVSGKTAKEVLEKMWASGESAAAIITREGLAQISDVGALESLADKIIAANPQQVEQYRGGKDKLFGFFVGQMMKETRGQANPAQANEILRRKLGG